MSPIVLTRALLRLALAVLFGYFGWYAVTEPAAQADIWINSDIRQIIENFLPVMTFMLILGSTQLAVALILAVGRFLWLGLGVAALLLGGILTNLILDGSYDLALRDGAIMAVVLYLLAQEVDAIRHR